MRQAHPPAHHQTIHHTHKARRPLPRLTQGRELFSSKYSLSKKFFNGREALAAEERDDRSLFGSKPNVQTATPLGYIRGCHSSPVFSINSSVALTMSPPDLICACQVLNCRYVSKILEYPIMLPIHTKSIMANIHKILLTVQATSNSIYAKAVPPPPTTKALTSAIIFGLADSFRL